MTKDKNVEVYRIENDKQGGPYDTMMDGGVGWWKQDHNNATHPGPEQDEELQKNDHHLETELEEGSIRFCFSSLMQLHKWFLESEIVELHKRGFHIMKLHVKRILAKSKFQAVVNKSEIISEEQAD